MSKAVLDISSELKLPLDYVTQTGAILARRGAGKTYTALKIAEEFARNGLPFVAVDPTGVMWGLRSSASGEQTGWPIIILGGEHGDLPLEPSSGRIIAEYVVNSGMSVVLDLSLFETNEESDLFLFEFADRLYRYKAKHREPLHLLLDEADQFCPQQVKPNQAAMLAAWEKIVRLGRSRGLGMTMITQRPAVLNKNVLTQIEVLFALQVTGPQDRKAILDWVSGNATKAEAAELIDSLASLHAGEGWIWSPGWLRVLVRVQISLRKTFDSSRTPEAGERLEPKKIAPVDLAELGTLMAATIERVEANDPVRLQARIRDLELELKELANQQRVERAVETVTVVETIEVVPAAAKGMALRLLEQLESAKVWAEELAEVCDADLTPKVPTMAEAVRASRAEPDPELKVIRDAPVRTAPVVTGTGDPDLIKADRAILTVLAQFPEGRTIRQIAMLTGYSAKGGGFRNALGKLRGLGYMDRGDPAKITPEGIQAIGSYEPMPTGQDLLDFWCRRFGKAERLVLEYLASIYPATATREEVAAATGYEPGGGGFRNAFGKLRTMELVEGSTGAESASADLMAAVNR